MKEAVLGGLWGRWFLNEGLISNTRTMTFLTLCWLFWLLGCTHRAGGDIQMHFQHTFFPWPLCHDIRYLGIYRRSVLFQGTPDPLCSTQTILCLPCAIVPLHPLIVARATNAAIKMTISYAQPYSYVSQRYYNSSSSFTFIYMILQWEGRKGVYNLNSHVLPELPKYRDWIFDLICSWLANHN